MGLYVWAREGWVKLAACKRCFATCFKPGHPAGQGYCSTSTSSRSEQVLHLLCCPPCLTLQVEHQQQALPKEGQAQEGLREARHGAAGPLVGSAAC